MTSLNLELSTTTRRLVEMIVKIPMDHHTNNNKEKLNEIMNTLLTITKMALLLDPKNRSNRESTVINKDKQLIQNGSNIRQNRTLPIGR